MRTRCGEAKTSQGMQTFYMSKLHEAFPDNREGERMFN